MSASPRETVAAPVTFMFEYVTAPIPVENVGDPDAEDIVDEPVNVTVPVLFWKSVPDVPVKVSGEETPVNVPFVSMSILPAVSARLDVL